MAKDILEKAELIEDFIKKEYSFGKLHSRLTVNVQSIVCIVAFITIALFIFNFFVIAGKIPFLNDDSERYSFIIFVIILFLFFLVSAVYIYEIIKFENNLKKVYRVKDATLAFALSAYDSLKNELVGLTRNEVLWLEEFFFKKQESSILNHFVLNPMQAMILALTIIVTAVTAVNITNGQTDFVCEQVESKSSHFKLQCKEQSNGLDTSLSHGFWTFTSSLNSVFIFLVLLSLVIFLLGSRSYRYSRVKILLSLLKK